MYHKLVEKFREKLCNHCETSKNCHKKPNKMVKCGIFHLVTKDDKE